MQSLGEEVESIHVDELGVTMSKHDIFKCLVDDQMEGSIEVDWRDFFPYLKWIPNKSFDNRIKKMCTEREAVMKTLIKEKMNKNSSTKVHYFFHFRFPFQVKLASASISVD